jgi:alpha,alpha-trehalose phosphorylase
MAKRHFEYAIEVINDMQNVCPEKLNELRERIDLSDEDIIRITEAAKNMYLPFSEEFNIYMQDDSYLYQDPVDMKSIPMHVDLRGLYHPLDLWRMQVSKQADVCLATFLHGDFFTNDMKKRCYDYYEPRCNHGSSLSPAIYSISAAELNLPEAYEFFRLAAYMDINDFKHNTSNGIHIACAGGVWMSVVNGFLGMRHYCDGLHFAPVIPKQWDAYATKVKYKGSDIFIKVNKKNVIFELKNSIAIDLTISGEKIRLDNINPTFKINTVQI